jgi:mono/diheme cytochrome c family protein
MAQPIAMTKDALMTSMVQQSRRYAVAACLVATSASMGAQSRVGPSSNPIVSREGEVIYRTTCQACHMPAGQGAAGAGVYPGLAGNSKLRSGKLPASVIVNGSRAMPPFRALLDDEQIAAVVNYVRRHFGNDYQDDVTAADVRSVRQ